MTLLRQAESVEPRLVRSSCPALGAGQMEILMPESEVSVMKLGRALLLSRVLGFRI